MYLSLKNNNLYHPLSELSLIFLMIQSEIFIMISFRFQNGNVHGGL